MADRPPPPQPPASNVQRFTPDGKPTVAQITYEQKLDAWLKSLAAAVSGN